VPARATELGYEFRHPDLDEAAACPIEHFQLVVDGDDTELPLRKGDAELTRAAAEVKDAGARRQGQLVDNSTSQGEPVVMNL